MFFSIISKRTHLHSCLHKLVISSPIHKNRCFDYQSDTCEALKMPKDRRSSSLERCRASPYSRCYKNSDKRRPRTPLLQIGNENEWEEARCPICMEHPHNAVLLLCSSREKGCLPYMCDTSYRHSNCLDQFRKSSNNNQEQTKLICPLCRGQINGCIVVNPARQFMDSKTRSCSLVTCDFAGNYSQLRTHARCKHPNVRPTDVDPEQEQEWRSMEENMEQQDMLSMQFEFDDYDEFEGIEELIDGVSELASPIGVHDLDFLNFFSNFETEFDSVFPEVDWDSEECSLFMDDWDNVFSFSPLYEIESREEYGRSRETTRTHNRSSTRPRDNTPRTLTRTRTTTNTHSRERSNSQPRSRNRQDQVTTLVDFHEFSSNLS